MSKKRENDFLPNYVVTPGEILEEYLESYGMTQAELSQRTGLAKKTINEIVKGKAPISAETALKFERVFSRPAKFWLNLEFNYQEDKSRIAEQKKLSTELAWLKKIPVKEMVNLGWIEENKDKLRQLEVVLNFFGIASPLQFEKVWRNCEVAFRHTGGVAGGNEAVFSWLRKGEIEAQLIACQSYNARIFVGILEKLKSIVRNDYKAILPELIEMCASAGVAVVCLRSLPKMRVYGAARWVGGKPLIQLSEAGKNCETSEHFLFTFFHEACHILKHGKKDLFLEGLNLKSDKEKEADVFAFECMSSLKL